MSKAQTRPRLPRPVWLLGWVSLVTDAATEAIYPLLPVFFTRVLGASVVWLGVVEGAAEAVNSGLKIVVGRMADRASRKRPFVLLGYTISSAVRPLMALTGTWGQVLAVRVADRVGKGIRGAPRDALLAEWATPASRGRIFGFHRAMDHAGAVVGPLLASLFLLFRPEDYRTLFALTAIPGALAVGLVLLVREHTDRPPADASSPTGATGATETPPRASPVPGESSVRGVSVPGVSSLPRDLRAFLVVLAVFTLGNSTDAFLLLRLTDAAGGARFVPLMWAALHVIKASASLVGGNWSDRVGRRRVIALGWLVYAGVYVGFAVSTSLVTLLVCFLIYGLYFGLTEGVEKALVADLAPAGHRGLAFGWYQAVLGLGSLAASVVFGLVWTALGAPTAFGLGAALALVATVLLFLVVRGGEALERGTL